jgi:hypothetical protein
LLSDHNPIKDMQCGDVGKWEAGIEEV